MTARPARSIAWLAPALALLGGCDRQAAEPSANGQAAAAPAANVAAPAPAAPTATVRALPASEQLALAFRAVYGAAPPASLRHEGNDYVITPKQLEWVGDTAVLLTSATIPDGCHACEGAIGVHYLRPEADGFVMTGSWPLMVAGTSFGAPTAGFSIRRDLGRYPMIVNQGAFMGQGNQCAWAVLAELTPDRPQGRGTLMLGFENSGAIVDDSQREIDWSGRIARAEPGQWIEIAYSGSDRFTERYMLRDGIYRRPSPSRLGEYCGESE